MTVTALKTRRAARPVRGTQISAFWFLLPAFLLMATFTVYPALSALWLSLHTEAPFSGVQEFVGLQNYRDLMRDNDFLRSLVTTITFALMTVPLAITGGLIIALLLHRSIPGIGVYRVLLFLPVAVPTATASIAWRWLYNPAAGYFNYFLDLLHLPRMSFLQDPSIALAAVAMAVAWQALGLNAILLLAGLQSIPEDLYEAARIDGASPGRILWRITLPLLTPILFFTSIVGVIQAMTTFGPIDLLTRGGPVDATQVAVYRIYTEGFINFRFGYATAQAVLLFVIILAFSLLQNRLDRRVHYQ
jgi:sn-glycerol 3-phosphate transport system permease protein